MTGLVRGTVQLAAHQKEWDTNAEQTMKALKRLLGDIAVDIQHVGSTAIPLIHAKPRDYPKLCVNLLRGVE